VAKELRAYFMAAIADELVKSARQGQWSRHCFSLDGEMDQKWSVGREDYD